MSRNIKNKVTGSLVNITTYDPVTGNITGFAPVGNIQLGPVDNVHITGGTAGQVLSTDGSGGLSWITGGGNGGGGGNGTAIANGTTSVNIPAAGGNVQVTVGGTLVANVTSTGATITGNLIPSANVTYDLGSPTAMWKSLYLGPNTLYINNIPITVNSGNALTFGGNPVLVEGVQQAGNIITSGNVTANGITANTITALRRANLGNVANVTIFGGTNGQFLQTDGSGGLSWTTGGGGGNGSPGGTNTQVQYNNAGAFGGDAGFTYNDVTNTLTVGSIIGNGSGLSAIAGANVTGIVANAAFATLAATANTVAGANVTGTVANATYALTTAAANTAGTVTTAAQPNITSVGTLSALSVTGNVSAGNVSATTVTGSLATAAQPNITSVGTLTALTVSGNANLGAVANVKIAGGTTGQFLSTDGNGNLSWATGGGGSGASISNGTSSVSVVQSNGNVVVSTANNAMNWTFATDGVIYGKTDTNVVITAVDATDDAYRVEQQVTDGANVISRTRLERDRFEIDFDVNGSSTGWRFESDSLRPPANASILAFDSNVTVKTMNAGANSVASLQAVSNQNDPNIFTSIDATTTGANIRVFNGGSNGGTGFTWIFDNTGNLTIPNDIISNSTIDIDNRLSGNTADIRLYSADDIVLQARDRTLGSTSEGGDINIYAGDSAEDSDSSGGDVQIVAGDGGAGNIDFAGSGGFISIRSGQGGAAIGSNGATAASGGDLTLQAGAGGDNNGNIDLGAEGGDIFITAGDTTANTLPGGGIRLATGSGGTGGLAGSMEIVVPVSDGGDGGTWTFDGKGNLTLPAAGNINGSDGTWVRLQSLATGLVRSGLTLNPGDGAARLESWDDQASQSFTSADWTSGEYGAGEGSAYIAFTDTPTIRDFFDMIYTSDRIFYQVNGGPLLPNLGWGGGGTNIIFYVATPPVSSPEAVTNFTIYYSSRSSIEINYDEGEMNLNAQNLNLALNSNQNIGIVSNGIVTASVGGTLNVLTVTSTGANVSGAIGVTGNIRGANLAITGESNLGAVANVIITGGVIGQLLSTDGNGNLSWTSAGSGTTGNITFAGANISSNLVNQDINILNSGTGNIGVETAGGGLIVLANGATRFSGDLLAINASPAPSIRGFDSGYFSGNVGGNLGSFEVVAVDTLDADGAIPFTNGLKHLVSDTEFTYLENISTLNVANANISANLFVDSITANIGLINGNLTVSGNLTYLEQLTFTVEDPIIQLGTANNYANGAQLSLNDGKDRGVETHTFGANLVTDVLAPLTLANEVQLRTQGSNALIGLAFYSNAANGANTWPVGTTVIGYDEGNNSVTLSNDRLWEPEVNDTIIIGSDKLQFMGYLNAPNTFVVASDVTNINNIITVNQLGNFEANTIFATEANLSANANIDGNVDIGGNLIVTGNSELGSVENVKILGGFDGNVLITDGSGNLSWGRAGATPGGSNRQVQYNNANSLGGNANFTFDSATSNLTVVGNIRATTLYNNGYSVINMISGVPTLVPEGEVVILPENKQAVYYISPTIDGTFIVDGTLYQV